MHDTLDLLSGALAVFVGESTVLLVEVVVFSILTSISSILVLAIGASVAVGILTFIGIVIAIGIAIGIVIVIAIFIGIDIFIGVKAGFVLLTGAFLLIIETSNALLLIIVLSV